MRFRNCFLVVLLVILSSCSFSTLVIKGKGNIKLKQIDFAQLNNWSRDDHALALNSFLNSCEKFKMLGDSRQIGGQIGDITVADFRDVCEIAAVIKGMSSNQARNFFENWFVPLKISAKNGNNKGLFTGYYEPDLRGSRVKTDIYKYPIYAKPKDLSSQIYYSRKEIESGALNNKGLELFYVSDPVDLFFMHVQGTGRVILEDGVTVKLSYAGKNNQPYTSIGSYMIENKIISNGDFSYDNMKAWLKNNPGKAAQIMNVNDSYIFFKISDSEQVIGAQGVPLSSERSLAIDNEVLPYGYPVWVDIGQKNNSYQKLLVTQDTGSAIKGVVRGDIFFGRGRNAEILASRMNNYGSYYILLPINVIDKFFKR